MYFEHVIFDQRLIGGCCHGFFTSEYKNPEPVRFYIPEGTCLTYKDWITKDVEEPFYAVHRSVDPVRLAGHIRYIPENVNIWPYAEMHLDREGLTVDIGYVNPKVLDLLGKKTTLEVETRRGKYTLQARDDVPEDELFLTDSKTWKHVGDTLVCNRPSFSMRISGIKNWKS